MQTLRSLQGKIHLLTLKTKRNLNQSDSLRSRLVKGAFWSVFGVVISRIVTLASSAIIARLLGKTIYGQYGMVLSTLNTFGVFAAMGLGMSATKYTAGYRLTEPLKVRRVLVFTYILGLFFSISTSLILIIFSSQISSSMLKDPKLAVPLIIGTGLIFFGVLNRIQNGSLSGFEAFKVIAQDSFYSSIISFPITVLATVLFGINGAIFGSVVCIVLNWAFNNYNLRKEFTKANIPAVYKGWWGERKILWEFTIPAALSSYLLVPVTWISNVLLVNQNGGYDQMALFSAANQWQSAILMLPNSIGPMVLSMLSSTYSLKSKSNYWKLVKVSLVINAGICGVGAISVGVLSPFIMSLYGKSFKEGWIVLCLLSLVAFLVSLNNVVGQIIASSASMWWGFILNLLWAIAFISFSVLWVGYGAIGLASAYVASYLCHMVWQTLYLVIKRKSIDGSAA